MIARSRRRIAAAFVATTSLAIVSALATARVGAGSPTIASASAPASSAGAAASAVRLVASAIPRTPSAAPSPADWESAPLVRPRAGKQPTKPGRDCQVRTLREWIRISCHNTLGVSLVAGPTKDVTVYAASSDPSELNGPPYALAVFPLRPGESHVFQTFDLGASYDGMIVWEGDTFQIGWRRESEDPELVVTSHWYQRR